MNTMSSEVSPLVSKSFRGSILWYNVLLFLVFISQFPLGIGFTLFEIMHLLPYAFFGKKQLKPVTLIKAALALIISILFWNRADISFQFLAVAAVSVLNYSIFYEVAHDRVYAQDNPLSIVSTLFRNIVFNLMAFIAPPNILPQSKSMSPTFRRVLYGLIISIPILLILASLFSSADAQFEAWSSGFMNWVGSLLRFEFIQIELWEMMILGFFFGCYVVSVIPTETTKELPFETKALVEALTITSLVAGIFGIFIASQYQNVQTILEGFRAASLNPRDFVREGFYQMIVASGIAFVILYVLEQDLRKKIAERLDTFGKGVATILLLEVVVVIGLAFQRVWAYQYAYGYTQIRLWGMVLVAWLLSLCIVYGGKLYRLIPQKMYMQAGIIVSALWVLVAGVLNVDNTVAAVKPPTVNGQTDYAYVGRLSYDAAPVWETMLETVEEQELPLIQSILSQEGIYYYENPSTGKTEFSDSGMPAPCTELTSGVGLNLAVNRGKVIVCEHLEGWRRAYESNLDS